MDLNYSTVADSMSSLTSEGPNTGDYHFDVVDYCVFASMLLLSALTGLYYGCRSRYCKSIDGTTLRDYLTGNKTMKPFPVAMSLVASYISGVTILGTPAEIYNFGTQYWLIGVAICLSSIVVTYVYMPVFCKLEVLSSYEYLELRFNGHVRTIASVLFVLDEVMFLPILIYVPSLAFSQVTGINLHLIGITVTLICVFYTVLGGLKAVVWTDTWQILVMFISVVVVVILGTISVGGLEVIWEESVKGNRIEFFNFNPSMYERQTVFGVIIGGFVYWTSFNAVNQTMVQRYLSLPTYKQAKWSMLIFTVGTALFVSICCFSGIVVYATYSTCDPKEAGRIKADDQLLPLFVMETVGHLRGVPGLFIAGVFGAALSSLSVILNSASNVFLEDFVKSCMKMNIQEKTANVFVRIVVVVLGAVSIGFMFVVERLGGVLATATSLSAIAAGTSFGMFSLGMLVPCANSKGAIIGGISGAITSGLVSFGTQFSAAAGLIVPHKLPVSVEKCHELHDIEVNLTSIEYPDESDVFPLFRLSFHWITPIGVLTVLLVGWFVSVLTGKTDLKKLDPDLISPICKHFLPGEAQRYAGTAVRRIRNKETDLSLMKEITIASIDGQEDFGDNCNNHKNKSRFQCR